MSGVSVPTAAPWRSEARLAQQLTWLAAGFALLVTLIAPAGYFWLSREAEFKEAGMAARLHAAFVTQVVSGVAVGQDWTPDVAGLIEADLSPSALPEARVLTTLQGDVLGAVGPVLDAPVLHRLALVAGREGAVAQVHVRRSLRPLVLRTLVVALGAAVFGLALFGTLRVLPLRALRRTLAALHREEGRAREEVEQRLRIVFEHSIEGIVTFAQNGQLLSCNPAACQLLGVGPEVLIGRSLADWVSPAAHACAGQPFEVGQCETRVQRPDGTGVPVELTVSEVRLSGALQYMATLSDITERHAAQDRLRYLANFDSLTGLPNRVLFRERLGQAMARSRVDGRVMALMFLDLDRFKVVNDSLGHAVGDALLCHVAQVLTHSLRREDTVERSTTPDATVSRLGGDEFTVIVEGLAGPQDAVHIARRILEAMRQPFVVGREEIYPSTSIGISLYPHDGYGDTDLDTLIRHTDMAMYRSKALGRGTFSFYSQDLSAEISARLSLEQRLRHALERGEFVLHYQPKADLRTGAITGVEALLRWQPVDGPMVLPDQFIGVLEDTGLIEPVGAWVIRTACAQVAAWAQAGLPWMNLAVNLSARQFRQSDLTEVILGALQDAGMPAHSLEVELTESMVMEDSEASLATLAGLGAMGVRVAIDDFGTGHSSLSYLKRFSVNTLKIDRSFVRDTPDDTEDSAIARAVVALGHSLQLRVVAEGVETAEQAAFLGSIGCDEMQGYWLGRPMPADGLQQWWQERHVSPLSAGLDRMVEVRM